MAVLLLSSVGGHQMRKVGTALILAAVFATSVGAFSRLIVDSDRAAAIASSVQASKAPTPLERVRALMRQQNAAQKSGGKSTATIQTDLLDYAPNTQVNVTGGGWLPGELVELTFTEVATTPPGGFTDG